MIDAQLCSLLAAAAGSLLLAVKGGSARPGNRPAAAGRAAPRRPKSTITGDVRLIPAFPSKSLGNRRPVWVWLPPGYRTERRRRYPVLYMHDGQNCFDAATSFAGEWCADETADRLIRAGEIPPIIIVAVANAGVARATEYTSTVDPKVNIGGGRADDYARFLLDELKPAIDRRFRTQPGRETTGVAGSSLGGLISMHIASRHADRVGLCAALSPSLWWNRKAPLKELAAVCRWTERCRLWFDMGTAEQAPDGSGERASDARKLVRILESAGRRRGADFQYLEVPGGQHNEAAWAARFDQVLRFLFAAPTAAAPAPRARAGRGRRSA